MAHVKYNRIKVVLAEKGIKNIELAKSLNVKAQTVSNWCTNAKQPSVKQLYAIAKVLGVDAKDLLLSVHDV
jgi:putative transcriptional regulator